MTNAHKSVIAVFGAVAVMVPLWAHADKSFGAGDDDICLLSRGGVNMYCEGGGTPAAHSGDYVINGDGDDDRFGSEGVRVTAPAAAVAPATQTSSSMTMSSSTVSLTTTSSSARTRGDPS